MLVHSGLLSSLADIFSLSQPEKLLAMHALPGLGEKKIPQILLEIETTKQKPLWRWLHALGVPGVGKKTAQELEQYLAQHEEIVDWDDIVGFLQQADVLQEMYGL